MTSKWNFIIIALTLLGCRQTYQKSFDDILNQHLINIVEPIDNKTGKLFPPPGLDSNYSNVESDVTVYIKDEFVQDSMYINQLMHIIMEPEYQQIISTNKISHLRLDLSRVRLAGEKYGYTFQRLSESQVEKFPNSNVLIFFQPLISEHYAIIGYILSSGPKSGFKKVILLSENEEVWHIVDSIEIERW